MIDFNSLEFIASNKYSFVGIEKKQRMLYFYLPKGFDLNFNLFNMFEEKRDLFFLFYRLFDAFKKICIDKGYLENTDEIVNRDRDGVINFDKGSHIQDDGDDSENVFYSKLDIIGSLLNAYDEPKILSLAYRLGKSDRFDVSQIHKYLHQAIYLPNNAAYVDQMLLPRKVVQFESTDIVAMYCYLFCEVKQQLKEIVNGEIEALAERFKEKYLKHGDSIFDEESYEQVINILKDTLETVDHHTPIKDADYWQYYEAIELFLYGDLNKEEDGKIWGISNFYSVWESMCLTYILQNIDSHSLLYLDSRYVNVRILEEVKSYIKAINLSNKFKLNESYLTPDAVILSSFINQLQLKDSDYKISSSSWDDYGYRTSIKGDQAGNIAYIGQPTGIHTIEKLKEIYPFDIEKDRMRITSRLPQNFYSFWDIPDSISWKDFIKMRDFNHFFYIALENYIVDWDDFVQEIFQPLDIVYDKYSSCFEYSSSCNVFTDSFFRSLTPEKLKEKFVMFINQTKKLYENLFCVEVIDIKYMTSDYLHDRTKIEEIKSRSVRKQFIYEYLIQKELEKRQDKFSNLSIQSSFWLPSYRPDDPNLIEDGEIFMDGYIQLKNINFAVLAENYLS